MWYNVITIFTHHIKCKHKRVCQDCPVQKTNENKLDQQLYLDLSKWSTIQIWNKPEIPRASGRFISVLYPFFTRVCTISSLVNGWAPLLISRATCRGDKPCLFLQFTSEPWLSRADTARGKPCSTHWCSGVSSVHSLPIRTTVQLLYHMSKVINRLSKVWSIDK